MPTDIWILGGFQSDFARNLTKEGLGIDALTAEVVVGTLDAAGVAPAAIEALHVANAFGELFTGQAHLGAMPATVVPELWGVPASRHEAACASGSIATRAAMADLAAGYADAALVVGVEVERNVGGAVASDHLGAAAFVGHEGEPGTVIWADMFDQVADEYDRRYGLDDLHLRSIGARNLANAARNPNAQTRSWYMNKDHALCRTEDNPAVGGRVRIADCSQVTDGAVTIFLASRDYAERWARGLGKKLADVPRIKGWGHNTARLKFADKVAESKDSAYVLPHVRSTITSAMKRAKIADVSGIDGIETHDCFTTSEYMAIDHFGLTAPGESWKAIEAGWLEIDGKCPINPSGGLIGAGHPVGATGCRQVLDAALQVTGQAGAYQVEGAKNFQTLNIGGSGTTSVSFVVGVD